MNGRPPVTDPFCIPGQRTPSRIESEVAAAAPPPAIVDLHRRMMAAAAPGVTPVTLLRVVDDVFAGYGLTTVLGRAS